jgi:hypothetical protein
MADNIFIDGLHIKKPTSGAPEFIKGKVSIHADRLTAFIAKHKNENGYVNVDLKESRDGELYFALNTYKKETQESDAPKGNEQIAPDDIPF